MTVGANSMRSRELRFCSRCQLLGFFNERLGGVFETWVII